MNSLFNLALLPALLAGAVSYSVTPIIIKLAHKIGIIDDPKIHKHPKVIHTYPVPRGGGLATFVAILAASVLFLPWDKHLAGILAGASLVTFIGLLDDKYDLNP